MRLPGLPSTERRRGRVVEYVLVIATVTAIVVLATWFLGNEIATDIGQAARPVLPVG